MNINHKQSIRDVGVQDRFGVLRNVQERSTGLFADLLFNPKHPLAEMIIWQAENDPNGIGLSHNAQGRTHHERGLNVVEDVLSVASVDVVANPSATRGLFESRHNGNRRATTPAEFAQAIFSDRPRPLLEVVEDELVSDDIPVEPPLLEPTEDDATDNPQFDTFVLLAKEIWDSNILPTKKATTIAEAARKLLNVQKVLGDIEVKAKDATQTDTADDTLTPGDLPMELPAGGGLIPDEDVEEGARRLAGRANLMEARRFCSKLIR